MTSTALTLDHARRNGGKPVLIAAGEIDLSNIDAFSGALTAATAEVGGGETLTIDLSAVEYLDSCAINAMAARADEIDIVANPLLISALTVSGLAELVSIEVAPPTAEL